MGFEFSCAAAGAEDFAAAAAACDPANPFLTHAYAEAMRRLGYQPFLLTLREGTRLSAACAAFLKAGRLSRALEIVSLPALAPGPARERFWEGLRDFCRRARVSHVEAGTFASDPSDIPALPGEVSRRARREYVLDLRAENVWAGLSSNHLRNVKAARKAGVGVRRGADAAALGAHLRLIESSLERRRERGEDAQAGDLAERVAALAGAGAGELFQASLDGEVLSSIFVLLAERGGYYQSAGTSPEGMARGASHFLVHHVAEDLRGRGMEVFNLGGADESSAGLQRFKGGFGARAVELEAAEFFWGSALRKKLGTAARLLREDPARLAREALGRVESYVVYAAAPEEIAPPEPRDGYVLSKLSGEEVAGLGARSPELGGEAERYGRGGSGDAYALFVGGELAHVASLVTAEHDRALPVRNVKLRAGEAEITNCLTLSKFRGKGVYPFVIRGLAQVARERGVRRLYMMTGVGNAASRRGIEKAGFTRRGRIVRFVFSHLPGEPAFTYRGHRLGFLAERPARTAPK